MYILLAEDSPLDRRLVERLLNNLGHETATAVDGDEAWDLFLQRRPDVIISDWTMPNCSGLELCTRIRNHGGPYTHFILLTGKEEHEYQLQGIEAGADDYLVKPLDKRLHELAMRLIVAERLNALHGQLRSQRSELESLNKQLYRDGRRCALTGIANRLQLNEDIQKLHALTHRHQKPFSFAIFDIDHFKKYNDTCGHVAGDEVLRQVGAALDKAARKSDKVYRYGGEEFVAIYPFGNIEGALVAANRMRGAIEALNLPHPGRTDADIVTLSGGVVTYLGTPPQTIEDIISAADTALYKAKEQGRNRILAG